MSSSLIFSTLLAVFLTLCCGYVLDEDFGFEISDDLEVEFPPDVTRNKLDSSKELAATVGHIFHLVVPRASSSGDIKHFEAKLNENKALPSWLLFDKTSGVFWGVPLEEDVGVLHISVKAVHKENTNTETFTLRINGDQSTIPDDSLEKCPGTEDSTVLTLIIDKSIKAIKPKQRVIAINNIAKFFGLTYNAFWLKPELHPDDITDSAVILAGPGNLKTRASKISSFIQVTVGCEGRLWLNSAPIVHQLKQQARDGTISEVLRLPLNGWRVKTETQSILREKRQEHAGSGDDTYEYEYEYDDYDNPDDDDEPKLTSATSTAKTSTRAHTNATTITTPLSTTVESKTHPHRHHHGEFKPDMPDIQETSPVTMASTTTSTTQATRITDDETEPDLVTSVSGLYKPSETLHSEDDYDDEYDDSEDDDEESSTDLPLTRSELFPVDKHLNISEDITTTSTASSEVTFRTIEDLPTVPQLPPIQTRPSTTSTTSATTSTTTTTTTTATTTTPPPITLPPTTTISTTEETAPVTLSTTPADPTTTSSTTTITTTTTTTTPKTTTLEDYKEETLSTVRHPTTRHVTSPPLITESVEYEVKNFAPTVKIRLNRIAITVGKVFTQIIPERMFEDTEDDTNLTLEFLDKNGVPVKNNSWCQFNPHTREIYGLPLGEDISGWEYILKATDKEGASVSEKVEIVVQQHKHWRVVNHEFSLYARVEKKQEFSHPVDWALHISRGINSIFASTNTSKITVRTVNYDTDPIIFTWTNDTLATNYCPSTEIDELFGILTANDEGDPSIALSRSLAPELRAKKITQRRLGVCEETEAPQPPLPPPLTPPSNLAPILRNEVNHINATIGELLVFRVPDDTFYDPEEVNPRDLTLELHTVDMEPISPDNWLQFDTNNKEFYGIPSSKDVKRVPYQLVCKDSGGLYAVDALIVQIHPATKLNYNVEFNVTIEINYETFTRRADLKRKFITKLKQLLGDADTKNIVIHKISKDFTRDFTTVTWFNKSLTREECPWDEIKRITAVFVNTDHAIMSDIQDTMGPEFLVSAFSPGYHGVCHTQPITPRTGVETVQTVDESNTAQESSGEYLITFIVPAVIITVMLLLAAIAACVLYRKRRSGKMNIEEDGRQSYGNKGIPVIFQEELDEKPESGTKAPVILKDEKPPLAPPEYSKSGSLKLGDDSEPYQPPPPFTRTQDNGRQARPKPTSTPTYRKPPPYVPP